MTVEQRQVIADVGAFLSPAWFAGERQERVTAWHRAFGQRIDGAFALAEKIRVFESIGPEDDGIRRKTRRVDRIASGIRA